MRLPLFVSFVIAIMTVPLLVTSCGVSAGSRPIQRKSERSLYRWYDDGGAEAVSIHISLTDQVAEFKRGGRDIGWCYVATGKEGHGTRPGSYKITEKIADKHSNRYGWFEDEFGNVTNGDAKYNEKVPSGMVYVPAPMPYWMRLTSAGVGMHGGHIPEPGEPASHGCIRLPKTFVPVLFETVVVGTPVTITSQPSSRFAPREALPEKPWSQDAIGSERVEAVTYRNGVPVSYR